MIDFDCPKCGYSMASPDSMTGKAETCPRCGNVTFVPHNSCTRPAPPIAERIGKQDRIASWRNTICNCLSVAAGKKAKSGVILGLAVGMLVIAYMAGAFKPDTEKAKRKLIAVAREMGGINPYVVQIIVSQRERGYDWSNIDPYASSLTPDVKDAYLEWREAERQNPSHVKIPTPLPDSNEYMSWFAPHYNQMQTEDPNEKKTSNDEKSNP